MKYASISFHKITLPSKNIFFFGGNYIFIKKKQLSFTASKPESQECPLGGLYNLKGAIGPPYISSRHKRNHSNKMHNHHHHETGSHRRYLCHKLCSPRHRYNRMGVLFSIHFPNCIDCRNIFA